MLRKLPENPKGNPLEIARIAGIAAAKRTSDLIPLCHPLMLSHADVDVTIEKKGVRIVASAATSGQTGVEMEALTAAAVAALTVYDMVKALDKIHRNPGSLPARKDRRKKRRFSEKIMIEAAVLTISDSASKAGNARIRTGPARLVRERLEQLGWRVPVAEIVPDEAVEISARLSTLADGGQVSAIFTTEQARDWRAAT